MLHLWSSHSPKLWWMGTSSRHGWRNRPDRQQHIPVQCLRSSLPFQLAYCKHGWYRWIRLCRNYVHILFPSVSNLVFPLKPHLPDQNLVSRLQGSTTDLFAIPGFVSFPSLANPACPQPLSVHAACAFWGQQYMPNMLSALLEGRRRSVRYGVWFFPFLLPWCHVVLSGSRWLLSY